MMCGHEKRLTALSVGEALLNLGLSVVLVWVSRNLVYVAVGSLIASFIFGWFFLWPWAAGQAELSGWKLVRMVLGPTWLACLPLLVLIAFERSLSIFGFAQRPVWMLCGSGVACLLAAVGLWRLALTRFEREKLAALAAKTLSKRNHA
ncbi:MAG: hypothetical protein U1G07_08375 [Verrucomicrobiota bacterium]